MRIQLLLNAVAAFMFVTNSAIAEEIGHVDTAFKLIGRDHRVVVEAFDDPKVRGVTCFVSMARKGGISGTLGLAEETSDASIACRQIGPISFVAPIDAGEEGEEVFKRRQSILFKRLQVVRFLDRKRKTLVYLAYSDKLIDGSPKNAISAVAMMPWGDTPAGPIATE